MSADPVKSKVETIREAMGADSPDDDIERDLWNGSFSGKSMVGSWIIAGIVSVLLIGVTLFTSLGEVRYAWPAVLSIIAISWLFLIGIWMYRKLGHHYELTSQRLKHRDGILMRKMNRIELIDVDDVTYTQGPIETLMGVGHIKITSSDRTHPELVLRGIADVRQVADVIDDARRTERRNRGIHIEAV